MEWRPGATAFLTVTFTSKVTGLKTDPSTITLKVRDPSKNLDTYTFALNPDVIEKVDDGIFRIYIPFDEEGVWRWDVIGTGDAQGHVGGNIHVKGLYTDDGG